jgi:hypothetical protein
MGLRTHREQLRPFGAFGSPWPSHWRASRQWHPLEARPAPTQWTGQTPSYGAYPVRVRQDSNLNRLSRLLLLLFPDNDVHHDQNDQSHDQQPMPPLPFHSQLSLFYKWAMGSLVATPTVAFPVARP